MVEEMGEGVRGGGGAEEGRMRREGGEGRGETIRREKRRWGEGDDGAI